MEASTTATEADTSIKTLRQELKEWESTFFATYKRKAGREDIKQQPEIGEKYKKYDELRYPSTQTSAPKPATPSTKRPHSSSWQPPQSTVTPKKRPKTTHPLHPSAVDPYDAPVSTRHSPTVQRTSIGPTPQKDGMVLGLFDNLSSGSYNKTPLKRRSSLASMEKVQVTPSKHLSFLDGESQLPSTGKRHHKSPLSTTRQSYLNTYLTPSVCRIVQGKGTPSSRSGVSKLRFDDTPTFLRRDSQRALIGNENSGLADEIAWSPVAVRKQRKTFAVKGLSALVKGLRDMEEERLDDELDLLGEMEGVDAPARKVQDSKVLVDDSQRPDMPLGPDGGSDSESDNFANEGKGRDGKPLRVWKKKGQKRMTRKVVMKPNAAKWKPEPAWEATQKDEDESGDVVEEIQFTRQPLIDQEFDSENDDLQSAAEARKAGKMNGTTTGKGEDGRIEKFATKVRRKISATAHTNFRALKIKNKQSKGKRGGKFGRKR